MRNWLLNTHEALTPLDLGAGRRLRVAILGGKGIPARYGGFETFAEQLSLGLVRQGVDVTVYAEGSGADVNHDGVRVRYVRPLPLGAASVVAYDVQCLWRARRSFDVVYMLGYGAAWGCFIPRLWGTRVWVNMDGLEWARSKWHPVVKAYLRLMERVMAQTVDRVIADAKAIKRYYEDKYPTGAPCSFIPYGAQGVPVLDAKGLLKRYGLSADRYFLVVARMEPENHIHEIIRAHQQWSGDCPLVVVGDHTADNAYCRWICQQRSPSIVLLGAVYDADQLAALRSGALAYVHGHSVGGTNPSLLESMWYGSVVVAHDNVFNREVLGDEGLLFSSEDGLANRYQQITEMTHSQKIHRKRRTREIVLDRYQWPQVVADYVTLLHQECGVVPVKESVP